MKLFFMTGAVMKEKRSNIAVVGGGIIGINCAYELLSLGFDVTVFDKIGVGEGCSKGNAGHFATEQVFPLADMNLLLQLPRLLLTPNSPVSFPPRYLLKVLPWLLTFIANMKPSKKRAHTKALKALNEKSIASYQLLLASINASHLITCNGSLLVFEHTPAKQVAAIAQHYAEHGVSLKILNKEQCHDLEPNLSARINQAIFFTDVAHTIDPYLLCKAIAEACIDRGGTFLNTDISSIQTNADSVTLHAENTHHQFDKVIIATGAWSKQLLSPLGYKVPLEAERGYHYQLGNRVTLNRPVACAERKFIITPMVKGLRCAGVVEFSGLGTSGNVQRAAALLEQAKQILTRVPNKLSGEQVDHMWEGVRPSLPDSLPVICQAPKHQNLFFAFGHQHLGLTQGAITGKLIGQLVTGQSTEIDTSPYCISRFN